MNRPPAPARPDTRTRRRGLPAAWLTLLALAVSLSAAGARRAQDEDDVVRVESDLVVLNVTVTDKQGRYVHKLARADFKVFEDGQEQPLSLFSVEETPFAAAILIDTSGSMESRVTLARAAAIRFLDGLREADVAAVYHFGSEVERLRDFEPGRDLPPTAYTLGAKGQTRMHDAVARAAADLSRRPERRRAIVLLSDGFDTRSRASQDKAVDAALAADAVVYTVNMMDMQASPTDMVRAQGPLRNYAEKTGGRYVSTPGGQAMAEAFTAIVEELTNQYTLGYRPANRARDGRWRAIALKLSRTELKTRTRSGYRAPKS
jgi:Ca-activated chloride channel family protein